MQGAAAIKRLNHLVGELEGAYHEASYLLGMSDSVSLVLYTLCTHGRSCPLHEICGQTGLSKQTVNSAVRGSPTPPAPPRRSSGWKMRSWTAGRRRTWSGTWP